MQAYRCAWTRVTVVVLASGAVVLVVAWALASPRTLAAALALSWLATRASRPIRSLRAVGRRWLRLAGAPQEHEAATLRGVGWLSAFLVSALGWHLLLGGAGTALLLVDALLGLPLLLPVGASLQSEFEAFKEFEGIPPAEPVDVPEPRSAVDVVTSAADRTPTVPTVPTVPTEPAELAEPNAPPGFEARRGPRTLLPGLSDTELWHAWRASGRALRVESNPAARLRIVAARSHYLDALAERDPEWMARQLSMEGSGWASFEPPT